MDSLAVDKERRAYPLAREYEKSALSQLNWEQVDVLDKVDLRAYLDVQSFGVLPMKSRNSRINTKGLIRLTVHCAFNRQKRSWGP